MNFMTFHILGIIIPTDFHMFQRGRYTTNQYLLVLHTPLINPYCWTPHHRAAIFFFPEPYHRNAERLGVMSSPKGALVAGAGLPHLHPSGEAVLAYLGGGLISRYGLCMIWCGKGFHWYEGCAVGVG